MEAHCALERFRLLDLGRRAGKSEFGGREAYCQLFVPESLVWVAGPTMDLAEKEFRVVWRLTVGRGDKSLLPVDSKSWREGWIKFKNGSFIECRSEENPNHFIGEGVDLLLLVEAASLKESSWTKLLRPTLADRRGKALFTSTPRGYNWFWKLWLRGQADGQKEHPTWKSWKLPSSVNPLVDQEEMEEAKRTLSRPEFLQEWMAEFTSFSGVVFPEFESDIHVRNHNFDPNLKTTLWIDPGLANPYSTLLVQITPDETIRVLEEVYVRGRISEQVIRTVKQRWAYAVLDPDGRPRRDVDVIIDEAAAEAAAAWQLDGWSVVGGKPGLLDGIEVTRRMLRDPYRSIDACAEAHDHEGEEFPDGLTVPRLTITPRCPNTIREFGQYHYPENSNNSNSEKPVDSDNHSISAIRYGLYATFPALFNQLEAIDEIVYFDAEEAGFGDVMDRARIDSSYTSRSPDVEHDFSLGSY